MDDPIVVNCKVAHIRPAYRDLEQWIGDPNNVYIGRRGVVFVGGARYPKSDSPWANLYKVGRDGSRADVLLRYESDLRLRLAVDADLRRELAALRGKTLGCWCYPKPCHGDVLVQVCRELAGPAAALEAAPAHLSDADLAEVLGFDP